MSRISWRSLAKVSVGCASALVILFFMLLCAIYFGPDKHEVTKYARTEWSKKFREVGLDDVPEHAKYAGGAWVDGKYGHWNFRTDVPTMHRWLSRSKSLRTAKIRTKPGRKAYLFYAPAARKACLVLVITSDGEARTLVETIDIGDKKSCSTDKKRAVNDAFEHLADFIDSMK